MLTLQGLGGLPFLSPGFDRPKLLAAAAAVRHVRADRLGAASNGSDDWIDPLIACLARRPLVPLTLEPLPATFEVAIATALRSVTAAMPRWLPYFELPIRYCHIPSGLPGISGSIIDYPQHIMLSTETLRDPAELSGQLIHEFSHQWLYLVEELWPLQTTESVLLELPSGTSDRQPREVLGAAHVGAVLAMYYREWGEDHRVVTHLLEYARDCLRLLEEAGEAVTPHGQCCMTTLRGIVYDSRW